jgi:hypothetical protein
VTNDWTTLDRQAAWLREKLLTLRLREFHFPYPFESCRVWFLSVSLRHQG